MWWSTKCHKMRLLSVLKYWYFKFYLSFTGCIYLRSITYKMKDYCCLLGELEQHVLNYLSHPERICSNLPFLTWMHTEILSRNAHKLKCQTSVSNRNVLFPSHKVFVAALNSLYDHLEPSFGYHDDLVSISPSTSATMRPIHISSFVCVINTFTVSLTFIQLQWATWSVFMVFKKHGSK